MLRGEGKKKNVFLIILIDRSLPRVVRSNRNEKIISDKMHRMLFLNHRAQIAVLFV